MKLQSFQDLFVVLLSDIFFLENQVVNIFPKLIDKVYSRHLKHVLQEHFKETEQQLKKTEKIFQLVQENTRFLEWSSSLKALFSHAEEFLEENQPSLVLDAAIIVFVQKIEHVEMATFGALKEFADVIDLPEVKKYLKEIVKDSNKADNALSKLAKGRFLSAGINLEASKAKDTL